MPCLLASLPGSRKPVLLTRSFPITAAGQSRTLHRVPSCDAWNTGEPTQWSALYWRAKPAVKLADTRSGHRDDDAVAGGGRFVDEPSHFLEALDQPLQRRVVRFRLPLPDRVGIDPEPGHALRIVTAGKAVGVKRREILREPLYLAGPQGTGDAFVIEVFAASQEITRRLLALVRRSGQQKVQPVPSLLDVDTSIGIGRGMRIVICGIRIHFANGDRRQSQEPAERSFRADLPDPWRASIVGVEKAAECRRVGEQTRDVRFGRAVQAARHAHIGIVSI